MPKPQRQTQHFAADTIAGECVAVRLRVLNRAVSALYDDALRPHGLRVGQLNLLVAIAHLGEPSPAQLCRVLRMDKSTLSRDTEILRRHGWIDLVEIPGRTRPLKITKAGHALIDRAAPAWRQAQSKARALMGIDAATSVAAVVEALWAAESQSS